MGSPGQEVDQQEDIQERPGFEQDMEHSAVRDIWFVL